MVFGPEGPDGYSILVTISLCYTGGVDLAPVSSPVALASVLVALVWFAKSALLICALSFARVVFLSCNRHACPTPACLSPAETADLAATRGEREG